MEKKTQQETLLNCVNALEKLHFQGLDVEAAFSIITAVKLVHDALVTELGPEKPKEE